VRLAEALAAPKGLIARGVRAAQRWQLASAAEDRKEEALAAKREAEEVDAMIQGGFPEGSNEAMIAREEARIREARGEAAAQDFKASPYATRLGLPPLPPPEINVAVDPLSGRILSPEELRLGEEDSLINTWAPSTGMIPWHQEEAPAAQAPLPKAGSLPKGSIGDIDDAERSGMSPPELLEQFGDVYANTLLTRLKYDRSRDKAMRHLQEAGIVLPPQGQATKEASPETQERPSPFPEVGDRQAALGYRAARRAQEESQAAKAKEVEDYAADMSLSTIEEVYKDFSKFAGGKKGPLDAEDFADFYEQLKFITDRDPALVEGLSLDPVGTKRQILKDAMAYFKFLNMGGDPKAAERRANQDKNLRLRNEALEARAKKRAADAEKANRAPGPPVSRDLPAGAPDWRTDLQNWAKWRDDGHGDTYDLFDVPAYLVSTEGRSGDAINEARKNLISFLEGEDGWGKPKGRWTTRQRKIFENEAKRLRSYGPSLDREPQVGGGQPLGAERDGDLFYWSVDGRGRKGTLADVVRGKIFTDAEVIDMMVEDGDTREDAKKAVEEARKAKKSKTTQRTKNAWSVIQDFSVADLQGNKSDVEARLDTGFFGRNKWDRLTDSKTQTKIREAISEILAAEEVEDVPQAWINIANKIKALGIRGL
tara:strand:- start:945 stop:2903 length:1959 start_codon:yes stop_codon:yes gene_type:complete